MKNNKQYLITQDQLDSIEHFKRMFELNAQYINELCNSEKDDIVYGFELGQRHSHLRECFMEMMNLESEIREQEFVVKAPEKFINSEEEAIKFTEEKLSKVESLVGKEYKMGFKEGYFNGTKCCIWNIFR